MFTSETKMCEYNNYRNCQCGCSHQCNNMGNMCKCGFDDSEDLSVFPSNYMFGQSYVPIQYMNKTFTPEVGLEMGTIFPELVSPYRPCQSVEEIEYIKSTNTIGKGCNTLL